MMMKNGLQDGVGKRNQKKIRYKILTLLLKALDVFFPLNDILNL